MAASGGGSTATPNDTAPLLHKSTAFTLRRARFADLAPASRTVSLGFGDDVLFGRLIHPHRSSYPSDVDKYWYRKFIVDYWDWSHVFLITTEHTTTITTSLAPSSSAVTSAASNKSVASDRTRAEVITGFAHWSRIAPSRKANFEAGWELAWWDPRE